MSPAGGGGGGPGGGGEGGGVSGEWYRYLLELRHLYKSFPTFDNPFLFTDNYDQLITYYALKIV